MDEANVWLTEHPEWGVINCETVLLFFKGVRLIVLAEARVTTFLTWIAE